MHTQDSNVAPAAGELERYLPERYRIEAVAAEQDRGVYESFLREAYEPLGFVHDSIRPAAGSRCYRVRYGAQTAAIFRLTPVEDERSPYFRLVPGATRPDGGRALLLEVNNVIVGRTFRATPALGLILRHCARTAASEGYDFVVGTTRYQTLRHFADFGVVPIDHAPLHLLGRPDLLDFTIFYDTADPASCQYIEQRSKHFFHQQYVLKSIQRKYATLLPTFSRRPDGAAIRGTEAAFS